MEKKHFSVGGMHCKSCAALIASALKEAEGIKAADVSFALAEVTVEFDPLKTDAKRIAEIIKGLGYIPKEIKKNK